MPTYEYECSKCGDRLEVVQSFTDDPLTKCPACGGRTKKVYGNVGIVFKGSGFYKTDSRNSHKAAKGAAASDKSATSDSGSSSESSTSSTSNGSDKSGTGSKKEAGSSSKAPTKPSAPAAAS